MIDKDQPLSEKESLALITSRIKPMLWGGSLCWALAIVALFTTLKIDLLLTALAAIIAWLIPGIIAESEYRKAKRQELLNV